MIKSGQLSFIFIILILSCTSKETEVKEENQRFFIDHYNTVDKQKQLLDSLLYLDQKVRRESTEAQQKFGYQSAEHKTAMAKMMETDKQNLEVIETYLRTYDYPSAMTHGKDANAAPYVVLHHAPNGFGVNYRERNIKYLHKAWKEGNLRPRSYAFFLGRFYKNEFGSRLKLTGSYKIEYEIDTLLKSLINNNQKIKNELDY